VWPRASSRTGSTCWVSDIAPECGLTPHCAPTTNETDRRCLVPPDRQQYSREAVGPRMLHAHPGTLDPRQMDELWVIFKGIGDHWSNTSMESAGQKSSWTEFVMLRCEQEPSYIAEYLNAIAVADEMRREHGERSLAQLFSHEPPPAERLSTRLDHAKYFVVDEFIRVQIIAGGFRGFGSDADGKRRQRLRPLNYNGFVRGSRYNTQVQVRPYLPRTGEP
jgi:hypothetical protein